MEKKLEENSGIEIWRARTLCEYYELVQAHIKDTVFFSEKIPLPTKVWHFAYESLGKAVFLVKQFRAPESKLSWTQRNYFDDHERASEVKQPLALAFCYLWECIANFNQFEDEIGGADYGDWPRRPSVEGFDILGWSALSVIDQFAFSVGTIIYGALKSVYGIEDSEQGNGAFDFFWDFVEHQTVILEPTLEPRALKWLQQAKRDLEKDLPTSKWTDSRIEHEHRKLSCELNFEWHEAWKAATKYEVGRSRQDSSSKEKHTLEGIAKTDSENEQPCEKMLTIDKRRLEATYGGKTYPITERQAEFLEKLIEKPGVWIPGSELKKHYEERLDKVKNYLPKPILKLIESHTRKGYRLKEGI